MVVSVVAVVKPDADPDLVTRAEFSRQVARVTGRAVARSTVTRWAQRGMLVTEGELVRVAASVARLRELGAGRFRPDVTERHAVGATPVVVEAPSADDPVDQGGGVSRLDHKKRALRFENQRERLQLALTNGERLYQADSRAIGTACGQTVRTEIELLIDRLAPRLAVEPDPARRRALLVEGAQALEAVVQRAVRATWQQAVDRALEGKL